MLVVSGSARPNSVNAKIVTPVSKKLKQAGATIEVADPKEPNLPF